MLPVLPAELARPRPPQTLPQRLDLDITTLRSEARPQVRHSADIPLRAPPRRESAQQYLRLQICWECLAHELVVQSSRLR
jgi:hypothetical protein